MSRFPEGCRGSHETRYLSAMLVAKATELGVIASDLDRLVDSESRPTPARLGRLVVRLRKLQAEMTRASRGEA